MTNTDPALTLSGWRARVAKLSEVEAARRTGLRLVDLQRLEQRPERATLGALVSYVRALGGSVTVTLELDGVERRLSL